MGRLAITPGMVNHCTVKEGGFKSNKDPKDKF